MCSGLRNPVSATARCVLPALWQASCPSLCSRDIKDWKDLVWAQLKNKTVEEWLVSLCTPLIAARSMHWTARDCHSAQVELRRWAVQNNALAKNEVDRVQELVSHPQHWFSKPRWAKAQGSAPLAVHAAAHMPHPGSGGCCAG
jgi:hypothetical protein